MSQNLDINLKKLKYTPYLELKFESNGKDSNHIIWNTLRRIVYEHIPTYAWNDFTFTKNTSPLNNDFIIERISNLPVHEYLDNNNKLDYFKDILNNELNEDVINNITMYVDKKNTSNQIMLISSDDIKFYNNDKEIESIYKKPVLITKLNLNQEIKFTAKTNINIGLNNIKYSSVSNYYFDQLDENKYIINVSSNGQNNEINILKLACDIIKIKMNNIMEYIKKSNIENITKGELIFEDEDHTIGNLLSFYLQDDKNILFAAYRKDHLLINQILISYETDGTKNIIEIFNTVIKDINNKFDILKTKFNKLE